MKIKIRSDDAGQTSRDPGRVASGYPPASQAGLEWHHDFPAAPAMPTGQQAEHPVGVSGPAASS